MIDLTAASSRLKENIARAVIGKDEAVDLLLIALLCGGHVLIEDVPGVGKTTLASALSRSLACSFGRIQFTPDITPSDIVGYTMPSPTGELCYRPGAVMRQIILADEINRTSPKTQSALLEVMEERQATVDGIVHPLPQPFMVLATQNPVDFVGTYPLPEAQMDRFLLRIALGYPTPADEAQILERYCGPERPMETLAPVSSPEEILLLQREVREIYIAREVRRYIVDLCAQTRRSPLLTLGVSTRGAIALGRASQARAMLSGRDFVIPEDVQGLVLPVLCHRLTLSPQARLHGERPEAIVAQLLRAVPVPRPR